MIKDIMKTNYSAIKSITAGAASDNQASVGAVIDRTGFESAVVNVAYTATLAEGKTATLKIEIQDSANDSTYATAVTLFDGVVATGGTGGTTVTGIKEVSVNLKGYERYFKVTTTTDLNATGTDTAITATTITLGDSMYIPVV